MLGLVRLRISYHPVAGAWEPLLAEKEPLCEVRPAPCSPEPY